jgi:hypothetical protein
MSFTKLSTSQNEFLESYLRGTGREMTVAQAKATFGIGNLRARVHEMRKAGLNVFTRKNYRGAAAYRVVARDATGSRAKVFA